MDIAANHEIFNLQSEDDKDQPKKTVQEIFSDERLEWKTLVVSLAKGLRDIKQVASTQVELYSQRQVALERKHHYLSLLPKLDSKLRKLKGERLHYYTNQYDRLLKKEEKEIMLELDTSAIKENLEILQSQIDYFTETIKSLDNQIFGIRHRLDLENYMR
jgi:hypothetical protein